MNILWKTHVSKFSFKTEGKCNLKQKPFRCCHCCLIKDTQKRILTWDGRRNLGQMGILHNKISSRYKQSMHSRVLGALNFRVNS